jgi:hypothetical protein
VGPWLFLIRSARRAHDRTSGDCHICDTFVRKPCFWVKFAIFPQPPKHRPSRPDRRSAAPRYLKKFFSFSCPMVFSGQFLCFLVIFIFGMLRIKSGKQSEQGYSASDRRSSHSSYRIMKSAKHSIFAKFPRSLCHRARLRKLIFLTHVSFIQLLFRSPTALGSAWQLLVPLACALCMGACGKIASFAPISRFSNFGITNVAVISRAIVCSTALRNQKNHEPAGPGGVRWLLCGSDSMQSTFRLR